MSASLPPHPSWLWTSRQALIQYAERGALKFGLQDGPRPDYDLMDSSSPDQHFSIELYCTASWLLNAVKTSPCHAGLPRSAFASSDWESNRLPLPCLLIPEISMEGHREPQGGFSLHKCQPNSRKTRERVKIKQTKKPPSKRERETTVGKKWR